MAPLPFTPRQNGFNGNPKPPRLSVSTFAAFQTPLFIYILMHRPSCIYGSNRDIDRPRLMEHIKFHHLHWNGKTLPSPLDGEEKSKNRIFIISRPEGEGNLCPSLFVADAFCWTLLISRVRHQTFWKTKALNADKFIGSTKKESG